MDFFLFFAISPFCAHSQLQVPSVLSWPPCIALLQLLQSVSVRTFQLWPLLRDVTLDTLVLSTSIETRVRLLFASVFFPGTLASSVFQLTPFRTLAKAEQNTGSRDV